MSLITRLRGLLQRRRVSREIDDELAYHVETETQANLALGMTPDEARQAALAAFGGVVQAKETVREVRTLPIESVWQDVRHASRMLARHRGFTAAAGGMLALAIGITTAMFTLVDSLMLRPVPFHDPQQLAHVFMGGEHGGRTVVSPAVLRAWRESPAFEAAESASSEAVLVEAAGTIVTRQMAAITPGVFDMLGGVRPIRGRLFDAREGRAANTVLVSETIWRTLFGADPALVGRSITVGKEQLTVVGILPAEFRFPSSDVSLWRPTQLDGPGELAVAHVRFSRGLPREDALRVAGDAARAVDDPRNATLRPWVFPLAGLDDEYSKRAVPVMAGAVGLVFIVLCANVCGLLLARLTARRREISMRAALGASRARLLRQAIVESGVLGAIGVIAGAGVAWALVSIARALLPEPLLLETLNPLNLDSRALVGTSIAGLVATLAAGLVPAWLGTRVDAGDSLRVVDRSRTETRGARLLTRTLLVAEVALACTLLAGATLLTRSFVNLTRADRGLVTEGVTTLWLALPPTAKDNLSRQVLTNSLESELRQLPGVRQLAWSYGLPPRGGTISSGEWIPDLPGAPAVNMELVHYKVSPEFFALYEIPVIRGRVFTAADTYSDVIVSERLARALWPGLDPIGRAFRFEKNRYQVIGLARETHYPAIDARLDRAEFYHPHEAVDPTPMVSLRCDPGCPDGAVIRHQLARSHPAVLVSSVKLAELDYLRQLERPRATAALALAFAAVATVAAAGGLFSVLSYAVNRRRREFGIRTALGATPRQIRSVVMRDGLIVGVSGLAIGTVFAAALTRALASLQYGVTPGDPVSWSIITALIALTTIAACWGPARAAAQVDPLELLREE